MLHAEIHGKVAAGADDAERSEDVLTSTVFGVLLLAEAWPVLLAWLARARPVGAAAKVPPIDATGGPYWFWPRLHDAEPDVVMRIGDMLFVVEAKYLSGKSGASSSTGMDEEATTDQLVREWKACSPQADMGAYPAPLREAIQHCPRALIYLARRSRWARELRAISESAKLLPEACMYLLTWEDLDDVLSSASAPWAAPMRTFLHRRGLSAFRGFGRAFVLTGTSALAADWRYDGRASSTSIRACFASSKLPALRALASYAGPASVFSPGGGSE